MVRTFLTVLVLAAALAPAGARADEPPSPPAPPSPPTPPTPPEPPTPPSPPAPPAPIEPRPVAPEPGRLGMQPAPLEALSAEQRAALGVSAEHGTVITRVLPGGPAEKAGLRAGDLLLEIGGKAVPPSSTAEELAGWFTGLSALVSDLKAGQQVSLAVLRDGKKTTLTATAVARAVIEGLERGAEAGTLPALATAGEPRAFAEGFEALPTGRAVPSGFFPDAGRWSVVAATGAGASGHVLLQDQPTNPWAIALFAGAGRAVADGVVSVRFRPISGREDASGGVIFRAKDARNYYLVRANGLEDNFRLYSVTDGSRWQIAEATVHPPLLGTWHVIEVAFHGTSLRATLDGKDPVEAKDTLYASGWCGLWTKTDSVTEFDDLVVTPDPKPPVPAK